MAAITPSDSIEGVFVVRPEVLEDERGTFIETYRRSWFPGQREMIQANRSDRRATTLVGLHYHLHQSDYWYVPSGCVRVVLHDLREGSPTDGATVGYDLGEYDSGTSSEASHCHDGIYIPPGVAHGFAALSDCTLNYLVDAYYNPADELGVRWDDPQIAADWGLREPLLSQRDRDNPLRSGLSAGRRPHYGLRAT